MCHLMSTPLSLGLITHTASRIMSRTDWEMATRNPIVPPPCACITKRTTWQTAPPLYLLGMTDDDGTRAVSQHQKIDLVSLTSLQNLPKWYDSPLTIGTFHLHPNHWIGWAWFGPAPTLTHYDEYGQTEGSLTGSTDSTQTLHCNAMHGTSRGNGSTKAATPPVPSSPSLPPPLSNGNGYIMHAPAPTTRRREKERAHWQQCGKDGPERTVFYDALERQAVLTNLMTGQRWKYNV